MMSIWKLRVGAENYYLSQVANGVEDYYTGRGEDSGRWLGTAATGLGLSLADPVVGDDLRAVLAGLQPGTGQSPNGGPPTVFKGRVPGFDLTLAAPKSVSVLYALGDPLVESVVVAAHDRAVDTALAWLERETCFVRRGSNNRASAAGASADFGTRRLPGAGFVAAGFRHRTSRAGDPHLHTHVLVANITRGPDGRWSALDAQGLYRAKHTAGAVFRTALAHELTEQLGVAWRPAGKGLIEIAGVPAEVLTTFSKRRVEIEAAMAQAGSQGAAAAAEAMLRTRAAKAEIDPLSMREDWAGEAAALGFDTVAVDALLAGRHPLPDETALVVRLPDPVTGEVNERQVRSGEFAVWVGERMADVDSTCTRHQILEIVATYLPTGISPTTLEDVTRWVLAQPELIPIPASAGVAGASAGWEQRWTSHRLIAIETETTEAIGDATPVAVPVPIGYVEHVINASKLGPDQAAAVRTLCSTGRTVSVLVGRAGTGKTYTLAAVREVLADFGHRRRIIGVAPSARAARELADGAGIEAFTFPRFELHQAGSLAAGDVVIVDEAGMAATVDLHRVISQARHVGAQVILVGDHHQLPEIGAGGVFKAAVDILGNQVAELTINRRQQAVWEHAALDELRHGNPQAGFRTYHEHGHVTIAPTTTEIHQMAVAAWAQAHRTGVNGVLLAGTRSEAKALNRLARLQVADELSGSVLEVRGRQFQAGDRVVLLRNSPDTAGHLDLRYRRPTRVDNGMIGTIWRIRRDGRVDLKLVNGTPIRLAADYVQAGYVDHGYATTIHKAQGITCDRMFLVGPAGLYREAVYVAMSRARHGSFLFATASQAAELVERPHTAGIPLLAEHVDELDFDVKQAVAQSRAKTLASLHDPLLPTISRIADEYHLDWLWNRHVQVRHHTARLVADGYTDPTNAALRLARARAHRQFLTSGTQVNAADWDNIGTVIAVIDTSGTAVVEFTSTTGRTAHKILEWADIRPVNHPEPADTTPEADAYFDLAQAAVDEHLADWTVALQTDGIHPDEPHLLPAAIAMRRQRLTLTLAAEAPAWVTYWYGARPADPAGAQVWDDEISHLAAWRDARHLDPDTPGYGTQPDDPQLGRRWAEHQDRSLATREWLHDHTAELPAPRPAPIDIAAVRERIAELDQLMADAPVDQTRIITALHNGELHPTDLDTALDQAAGTQKARRQWIVEHWPHVVEHAELTKLSNSHDPLPHWPAPIPPEVQRCLDELAALIPDAPDTEPLPDLDQRLADARPEAVKARLQQERTHLRNRLTVVDTALTQADDAQRQLLNQHRERLTSRIDDVERQIRGHGSRVAMWNWGRRPDGLVDAIAQRTNHLAHDAIANNHPWVTEAVNQWTNNHPGRSIAELHSLIRDIAAYRERANQLDLNDPLGPAPDHRALHQHRNDLDQRLQATVSMRPHVDHQLSL